MDPFTQVTTQFISLLGSRHTHRAVDDILRSATQEEERLRRMFAQDRRNPLLRDQLYIGLFDVFSVPSEIRHIRARSRDTINIAYHSPYERSFSFPTDHLFLLKSDLVKRDGEPCTVSSIDEFRSNWEIFTHGALKNFRDWDNVVVAGGAVVACLFPPKAPRFGPHASHVSKNAVYQSDAFNGSDIDLFLWGLNSDEAKEKMMDIYHSIQQSVPWPVTCVQKASTVTIRSMLSLLTLEPNHDALFQATYPVRPIQIVLRLYSSPAEVLAGFDVDCACCLYDGTSVYMNPRSLAAFIRQANTIDLSRRSPSYEIRLAKYANRGFEIYYPQLDRLRLDYNTLYARDRTAYPSGLALLIVLELLYAHPDAYVNLYQARWKDTSSTPLNFAPIECKLLTSNYDSSWIRIPYGPTWDANRINSLVSKIDRNMNSRFNPSHGARRMHRHLAVSGPMTKILATPCCRTCRIPITPSEISLALSEESSYITGHVKFIESNPGRQLVGSFNPLDDSDWSTTAYIVLGSPMQNVYLVQASGGEDQDVVVRLQHRRSDSESLVDENEFRSEGYQTVEETPDEQD